MQPHVSATKVIRQPYEDKTPLEIEKEKNASFSSPHLTPDRPNKSQPHHAMKSNELRAVDHDPITSELSTFGAHKYFNQGTINDTNIQKVTINSNSRVSPLLNMDTEQKHNQEQVKPPQTSSNLTKKLKTSLSKPIWLLRRKCPCKDKKSVQVKVNINTNKNKNRNTPKPRTPPPQPKTLSHNQIHKDSLNHKAPPPPPSSNKKVKAQRLFQFQPSMNQLRKTSSEGFTFPLFLATNSTNPTKPHHQVHLNVVHEEEDATPRESLHMFQPPSPPKSRAMDDDAASDASSDLFEIESFSTQTTTLPYPIITPSIARCHESTDHEFFFANDSGSSLWRRRLRDTEVLPPL
ncbi:Protein PHYTOCHROME KINASE SUBSTRATE 4 [Glycine max]|nr:Protein PHYTOCHROME KINASE SUBSTRATE 4 [Glycine max]